MTPPLIKFGTSGWRAVIAEKFTLAHVRQVIRAVAVYLQKQSTTRRVIVGYDTRFLSPEFAKDAAARLAERGFAVLLSRDPVPTPVVSFQILQRKASGGINFTASHNPPEYNGLKFNTMEGAPASPDVTRQIEELANKPSPASRPRGKRAEGRITVFDPRPSYLALLRRQVDAPALRRARLRVGVDVLYGTGRGYLDGFLQSAGCRTMVLHDWRDVNFGGQPPEPAQAQLRELVNILRQQRLHAGFATDGDADRFGVLDQDGTLLSANEILPVVLEHLVKTRGWKGRVVRSVMTSHFVDAVARRHDLPLQETPVGFKYIAESMREGDFLLGGEESGGLTIRGHVPEKDGILACLLMAEVRAVWKKSYREILRDLQRQVGCYRSKRVNLHVTAALMRDLRHRLAGLTMRSLHRLGVKEIVRMDGFKIIFQDHSWLGIRVSGTEPVVRLYLEANTRPKLRALEKIGISLIHKGD